MTIYGNDSLENLTGLENLESSYFGVFVLYNDSLLNLKGLEKLESFQLLRIYKAYSLNNLNGLNNLKRVKSIAIHFSGLESLNGLEKLTKVDGEFLIGGDKYNYYGNNKLKNYCAITNLINSDGVERVEYVVVGNAYNPSIEDIKAGRCSQ